MPNDLPDYTSKVSVQPISSNGQLLGDTGSPSLSADSGSEAITTSGGLFNGAQAVIASFKALTTLARVGVPGPVAVANGSFPATFPAAGTSITPAFGQATTAGNDLVACVTTEPALTASASAGWVKAKEKSSSTFQTVAIWVKLNCGAAEAAPTFTVTGATGVFIAQLSEYSGGLLAAWLDQSGDGVSNTSPITATSAAADAASGDLVVFATRWPLNAAATATFTATFNNGAITVHDGDSGAQSLTSTSSFSHAIVPAIAAALPLGVVPWDYDAQQSSAPAAGNQAKVVFPATPGKAYRLAMLAASVLVNAAVTSNSELQVLDGATVIFDMRMDTPTGPSVISSLALAGLALKGTVGNSMTVQFAAGIPSVFQTVNAGAYLR